VSSTDGSGRTDSFRPVLGASVLLFLTVLGIAGVKSSHDLEAARQRKLLLETRIQSAGSEIDRLRNRIARLRSDPGLLERHAREDLGMVRPGDVVIELPIAGAAEAPPVRVPLPPRALPPAGEGSTAKAAGPGDFVGPPVPLAVAPVPAAAPPAPGSIENHL
jgi:cell division protein FtsB